MIIRACCCSAGGRSAPRGRAQRSARPSMSTLAYPRRWRRFGRLLARAPRLPVVLGDLAAPEALRGEPKPAAMHSPGALSRDPKPGSSAGSPRTPQPSYPTTIALITGPLRSVGPCGRFAFDGAVEESTIVHDLPAALEEVRVLAPLDDHRDEPGDQGADARWPGAARPRSRSARFRVLTGRRVRSRS